MGAMTTLIGRRRVLDRSPNGHSPSIVDDAAAASGGAGWRIIVANVDVGRRAISMGRMHASGRRHSRGIGREMLEGNHRMRGHVSSIMSISIPAEQLVGLHGMLRGMTKSLHREKKRSGSIAVGLGKRKEREGGVGRGCWSCKS